MHININLEGSSQVALDWNIDRKIQISGDEIHIINTPKNINLKKYCQTITPYEIGDAGPAGGIVFYDKGSYSDGWRYAEVAPADLTYFQWGCLSSPIVDSRNAAIGKGLYNSGVITNFHDTLINFYNNPSVCNGLNNGTVAAKKALQYEFNYSKDWFLPSFDELNLIYANLHQQNIGTFVNTIYWSSTENDETTVKTINFATGETIMSSKVPTVNSIKTRSIRYF